MMTHDLARVRVCYQADVNNAFPRGQIGNICNPNLLGPASDNLFRACFKQVGMAAEPMMAMRSFMISTLSRNQLSRFAQDGKKTVSTNKYLRSSLSAHQIMQLACS